MGKYRVGSICGNTCIVDSRGNPLLLDDVVRLLNEKDDINVEQPNSESKLNLFFIRLVRESVEYNTVVATSATFLSNTAKHKLIEMVRTRFEHSSDSKYFIPSISMVGTATATECVANDIKILD